MYARCFSASHVSRGAPLLGATAFTGSISAVLTARQALRHSLSYASRVTVRAHVSHMHTYALQERRRTGLAARDSYQIEKGGN